MCSTQLSCEVRDLKQQLAGLQQDLSGLQEDANEKEKVLKDENQALSLKIAQTQVHVFYVSFS